MNRRGPISESQVEAMISLLTDASASVVDGCRRALLSHAEMAEPMLRERLAQQDSHSAVFQAVLDDIGRNRAEAQLIRYLEGAPDLEQGSLLIGRLVDGDAGPDGVPAALDAMADQVDAEPARTTDALAAMTAVLVRHNDLKGIDPSLAAPVDALLHGVTARRRGLPLPLCVAWVLIARRCRLPLTGVNMPGHFLVRWQRESGSVLIDPFHKARIVSEDHCKAYLQRGGFPSTDIAQLDASDLEMLLRTLRNLVMIASRRKDRALAARCSRILNAVEKRKGR